MTLLRHLGRHRPPPSLRATGNAGTEGPYFLPDQSIGSANDAGLNGPDGRDGAGFDGSQPRPTWERGTRHLYQPTSWNTRLFGMGGVMLVCLLIVGGALFTWRTHSAAPATLSVFDVAPPTAPPTPPSEVPPGPERQETRKPLPRPERPNVEPPEIPRPSDSPIPAPAPQPDPAPPVERTTAPERQPAPPAPKVSANVADTWEGKVLARLNERRRYPRAAMAKRQQGVPYVRFVMDRDGHVLSATLERSSGFPELDREAVALPRRAQPLPKPPASTRPGQATIELVVPVEFFVAR